MASRCQFNPINTHPSHYSLDDTDTSLLSECSASTSRNYSPRYLSPSSYERFSTNANRLVQAADDEEKGVIIPCGDSGCESPRHQDGYRHKFMQMKTQISNLLHKIAVLEAENANVESLKATVMSQRQKIIILMEEKQFRQPRETKSSAEWKAEVDALIEAYVGLQAQNEKLSLQLQECKREKPRPIRQATVNKSRLSVMRNADTLPPSTVKSEKDQSIQNESQIIQLLKEENSSLKFENAELVTRLHHQKGSDMVSRLENKIADLEAKLALNTPTNGLSEKEPDNKVVERTTLEVGVGTSEDPLQDDQSTQTSLINDEPVIEPIKHVESVAVVKTNTATVVDRDTMTEWENNISRSDAQTAVDCEEIFTHEGPQNKKCVDTRDIACNTDECHPPQHDSLLSLQERRRQLVQWKLEEEEARMKLLRQQLTAGGFSSDATALNPFCSTLSKDPYRLRPVAVRDIGVMCDQPHVDSAVDEDLPIFIATDRSFIRATNMQKTVSRRNVGVEASVHQRDASTSSSLNYEDNKAQRILKQDTSSMTESPCLMTSATSTEPNGSNETPICSNTLVDKLKPTSSVTKSTMTCQATSTNSNDDDRRQVIQLDDVHQSETLLTRSTPSPVSNSVFSVSQVTEGIEESIFYPDNQQCPTLQDEHQPEESLKCISPTHSLKTCKSDDECKIPATSQELIAALKQRMVRNDGSHRDPCDPQAENWLMRALIASANSPSTFTTFMDCFKKPQEMFSEDESAPLLFSESALQSIINVQDAQGNTLLHHLIAGNHWDMVHQLLNLGTVDLIKCNQSGYTPTMLAAFAHVNNTTEESILEQLLVKLIQSQSENYINSYAAANGRWSPHLCLAAEQGNPSLTRLLLQHGANVNISDGHGNTPLMCAAINGHIDTARILLNWKNCNPYLVNEDNKDAWELAMNNGHNDIAFMIFAKTKLKKMIKKDSLKQKTNCKENHIERRH